MRTMDTECECHWLHDIVLTHYFPVFGATAEAEEGVAWSDATDLYCRDQYTKAPFRIPLMAARHQACHANIVGLGLHETANSCM